MILPPKKFIVENNSHIAAFLDPKYKKYCFLDMTEHEIKELIRKN